MFRNWAQVLQLQEEAEEREEVAVVIATLFAAFFASLLFGGYYSRGEFFADMDDVSCSAFADILFREDEKHVADLLAPEMGGLGRESDTDRSVPGRLRGRQDKYEEIGAEPYIVASEFSWLIGCSI